MEQNLQNFSLEELEVLKENLLLQKEQALKDNEILKEEVHYE